MIAVPAAVATLTLLLPAVLATGQDTLRVMGRVQDARTGEGIAGAVVESLEEELRTETDAAGRFTLIVGRPDARLRVWAYGYRGAEVTVAGAAPRVEVRLEPRPIGLPGLTARAIRTPEGAVQERELYQREVTPAVIGLEGDEAASLPVLAEPDLLRSLQTLPGVLQLNDLSARLHVRGGGPDQNLFLLDGTRIYAPYHMFGMFGSFNPDAVGRVEFYRGAIPARHGGVLSAVVDMEQRDGSEAPLSVDLGVSLLAARGTASGRLPVGEGRWMLGFRESLVDRTFGAAFGFDSPVFFRDLQGRVSVALGPRHTLRATYYGSSDRGSSRAARF